MSGTGNGWHIEQYDEELDRLMATLPGMVYRADTRPPYPFEVVGGGYERIFGRSREELVANPDVVSQTVHPDDLPLLLEMLTQAVAQRKPFQLEYHLLRPDATMRTVWEQGRPVALPDGRLVFEGSIVDIDEPVRARRLQDATYRIAQAAASTHTLQDLYRQVHHIIGELMPAENLYIALRNPATRQIQYPYYVDEYDIVPPDPETAETGLTANILATGQPLLLGRYAEAGPIVSGELTPVGTPPLSWLGVPLKLRGTTIGVLAVQVYHGDYRYTDQDRDMLAFVADQFAVAIDRQRAAVSLRDSELRYRSLFEDSPVALWEEDFSRLKLRLKEVVPPEEPDPASWLHARPDLVRELASLIRVLDVNSAAVRLAGAHDKKELIGSLMLSMPDEALERFELEVSHILAGDRWFRWEGPSSTVDGRPHFISMEWTVAPGNEENLRRVLVAMIDITDRVNAENAQRASEARMRALLAAMNDLIMVLDRNGTYVEILPMRNELLARPRQELLGKTMHDVFEPALAERFLDAVRAALASQSTISIDYSLPVQASTRWFEARVSPLPGEQVLLVAHDATARHEAQEAARLEAEKAETYFNVTGVIIEVLDPELRLVRMNQTGYDFFGYRPEEIVGKPWIDMRVPVRNLEHVKSFLLGELAGMPIPEHADGEVVTRSGEERVVSWHDALLRDAEGRVTGLISSGIDITRTARLEQELQRMDKLESLGVLAGGIAHDFNNMLTGIIGNINLARIEDDPDRSRELLHEAEQEILQARGLSQQLLTFARGGTPVRSVQNLAPLIREAASFALRGSDVSLSFDIPADLWWSNVDAGQISQVISNIVINADEAMPTGGTVTVRARTISVTENQYSDLAPGSYVRIDIMDTGTGIPASDIRRVFDPFFSTKRRGSGLGLATAYSVVRKHDGYIDVTSTPGMGTTFSLFLPAVPPGPQEKPQEQTQFTGHGRVLVVDDEPSVRQVATAMLARLGYEAEATADGSEALRMEAQARAAGHPYDIIIMDLTIPGGMGGKEAAVALRAAGTPALLVASSGYATDPVMAQYRDYQFDAVLSKPYNFSELTSMLAGLARSPEAG